jgi:hypothetical protein
VNVGYFHSGNISEGFNKFHVFVGIDNKGSFLLVVSFSSHFSFSSSDGLGVDDFLNVFVSSELFEESDGGFGLFERFESVFNDEGEFGNVGDFVSSGDNQRGKGGGSQCGGNGVSSLFDIHFSVPSSVGFQRMSHSSFTTHVSEGSLSGSAGSTSTDSWNSGNCPTSSPTFGGVFHTSLVVDGVGLSAVFGQVRVDELDDVQTDGGLENGGEHHFSAAHLVRVFDIPYGY